MPVSDFTQNGKFLMLALDHRSSFKKLINPKDPESVGDETIISLKEDIIEALSGQMSAFLIDEVYGLPAYDDLLKICLKCKKPFLLPLEKSGFKDIDGERLTEIGYNLAQIIQMGASGAKLLLYFNPNVKSAKDQFGVAKKVFGECQAYKFPFFLELVTYNLGDQKENKEELVLSSVKYFLEKELRPDVFKLEYPGSVQACQKITHILRETPWILLTGGEDFGTFKNQLEVAAKSGCRGFLAGRALWQEVCSLEGEKKVEFLRKTLPERFRMLVEVMVH